MNNIDFNSTSFDKQGYMIQTINYYQNEYCQSFEDQIREEIEKQDGLAKVQKLDFVLDVKCFTFREISQSLQQFIATYNCTNECIPLLEHCQKIDYEQKINICNQLIDISDKMNEKKIFHNNLKPSNIFYYKGQVLLSEFGSIRTFQENLCRDFANQQHKYKQKEFQYFCPSGILNIIKNQNDFDLRRDALIEYYENLDINSLIDIDAWAIGVFILDILNPPNRQREFFEIKELYGINSEKLEKTLDLISQNIEDTLLNKIKILLNLEFANSVIQFSSHYFSSPYFSSTKNFQQAKNNLNEYYQQFVNQQQSLKISTKEKQNVDCQQLQFVDQQQSLGIPSKEKFNEDCQQSSQFVNQLQSLEIHTKEKLNEYQQQSSPFINKQQSLEIPSLKITIENKVESDQIGNNNFQPQFSRVIEIPSNEENNVIIKCKKFIKTPEKQYLIQDYCEEFQLLTVELQNEYRLELKKVIEKNIGNQLFEKALFHTQEKIQSEVIKYKRDFVNIKLSTNKNVQTFFSQFLQPCMKFKKEFDVYYRKIEPTQKDLTLQVNNQQFQVKFQGQLVNDIPNGFGFLIFSQTQMQLGIFRNGQLLQGWSIEECSYLKFYKYLHFYKGEFNKNQKSGKGKLKIYQILNRNQQILFLLTEMKKNLKENNKDGQFQNGQLTGYGQWIKYNQNGQHQYYEGNFQNGKLNGEGRFKIGREEDQDQGWQIGNFVNNKFYRNQQQNF